MADNEEFISEFLVEASESLDQLDQDLVALEKQPHDSDRLASIFRTIHTIKGTCGFFGFTKLSTLSHHGEHLLGLLRDGQVRFNKTLASLLLELVDAIRTFLSSIESTGKEGDISFPDLCQRLDGACVATDTDSLIREQESASSTTNSIEQSDQENPTFIPPLDEIPTSAVVPELIQSDRPDSALKTDSALQTDSESGKENSRPTNTIDATIRVDVQLLDTIVDLVGELVLARNQLRTTVTDEPALLDAVNRIHNVTGELQEVAMKTRMAPIDQLFNKFPRIVRDVAATCNKEVSLHVDGTDTELDRTLIEKIRDPLTHLIRNAVDHGIEPADIRTTAGKPTTGQLSLRAFQESGQVTIEVSDDGAGISVNAVRKKAVEKGLVTDTVAADMSTERIFQFIFEPGFSTAHAVTNISGRGVGMDVVRTNIESIGGTIDISSQSGVGTVVRVRIPLTLAIIPALIVSSGNQRLAIPQSYIQELVGLRTNGKSHMIEGLEGAPVLRLRNRLIPVVYLDRWLGLREWKKRPHTGAVVVVKVDNHEFGLVIDAVTTSEDQNNHATETTGLWFIVVKAISSLLAPMGIYSGATVMGDGSVVLILDLRGITIAADIPAHARRAVDPRSKNNDFKEIRQEDSRYLVCETHLGRRVAVPLNQVQRLENFPESEVDPAGDIHFVKRNGELTQLIDPDKMLHTSKTSPRNDANSDLVGVVLPNEHGNKALSVRKIIDVESGRGPLEETMNEDCLLGTLLVGNAATEILDIPAAIRLLNGKRPS
ncbi:MAG: chemotaxis protein CheA [Planctomycetaceae bacterium]|nr:chemotaxis protein CheA [Planctomycetaceae bacterium]